MKKAISPTIQSWVSLSVFMRKKKNKDFGVKDIEAGNLVKLADGKLYLCMRCNEDKQYKVFTRFSGRNVLLTGRYHNFKHKNDSNIDIEIVYGLPSSSGPYSNIDLLLNPKYRPVLWKKEEKH